MSGFRFVFCEGGDDLAVVKGLARSIDVSDLHIEPYLGKNNLRHFLQNVKLRPEFAQNKVASIGIIRDADEDGSAAFQSVCDALRANGFKTPGGNGGFAEAEARYRVTL